MPPGLLASWPPGLLASWPPGLLASSGLLASWPPGLVPFGSHQTPQSGAIDEGA